MILPDYNQDYILHVDACRNGLGAVIYQVKDGKEHVVAYGSRSLRGSERNYPTHKLEFLALKWAITQKFNHYLHGRRCIVRTDNNPLTYILSTAKLDATGHRWLAELMSVCDFKLQYKPAKRMGDADGLSRQFCASDIEKEDLDMSEIKAMCEACLDPVVETLSVSAQAVPVSMSQIPCWPGTDTLPCISSVEWRQYQEEDPVIGRVISYVEKQTPPSRGERRKEDTLVISLLRSWKKLELRDGVLCRKRFRNGQVEFSLVLPSKFQELALRGVHDHVGHQSIERTLELARERYYWPGMVRDVKRKVSTCDRCIKRKCPPDAHKHVPLRPIHTSQPLELVCLDFLKLEKSKGGFENVLVITDHYTHYAVAIPTRNQTARTTADVLFKHFIVHYGFPSRLHSDQGRNFESSIIKHLCQLAGMRKSRTTPYHPMGNGATERFNQTLLNMLGTLDEQQKRDWKSFVAPIVHAYNCARHDTTGFSPYELMFGRKPKLAVDVYLGLIDPVGEQSYCDYIEKLKERLEFAYKLASTFSVKQKRRYKRYYDRKARESVLEPGDLVLVRKLAFEGKHKLADRWESDIYHIVSRPNADLPVYEIQCEKGKTRIVHRNLLLPYAGLPLDSPPDGAPKKTDTIKNPMVQEESDDEYEYDDSHSDDYVIGISDVVHTTHLPEVGQEATTPPLSLEVREGDIQREAEKEDDVISDSDDDNSDDIGHDDYDVELPRKSHRVKKQTQFYGDPVSHNQHIQEGEINKSNSWSNKEKAQILVEFAKSCGGNPLLIPQMMSLLHG